MQRIAALSVPWKMTPDLWRMLQDRLFQGWNPEQICGRPRMQGVTMAGRQWIYICVRAGREAGGRHYLCLRRRGNNLN